MIECTGAEKRFGSRWAVRDVSFQVGTGICTLIGPNGAGKSTLLRLLTGLLAPDAGTIRVAGLPVTGRTLALRRLMGVVPEDLGLFDSLTIEEHLEMCGPIYGLAREETRRRTESLLRFLDLFAGRRTFLDQCSYGMRKKTAFAMALLHAPRVLFFDERLRESTRKQHDGYGSC
jgi:ABC-2 type transport system ATP-binding protein